MRDAGHVAEAAQLEELAAEHGPSDLLTFRRRFHDSIQLFFRTELLRLCERAAEKELSVDELEGQHARVVGGYRELMALLDDAADEYTFEIGDRETEPEFELPEPIVDGLIFVGLLLLSGPWKTTFKSTFALALTLAIHNGMLFLGRKTRQMRVGWVQRDMPPVQFVELGRRLRDGMGFPENGGIQAWTKPLDLSQTRDREALSAWVRKHELELLIVDSLSGVFGSGDENDAAAMRAVVRAYLVDELRDRLGLSVLVIAHPSRNSGSVVRGSGDSEASADSILKLTPTMDGERVTGVRLFGRGRHPDVELRFAVDDLKAYGGGFVVREVTAEQPAKPDPVWNVLTREWKSTSEIADEIGRSRGRTKGALATLLSRGLVERRNHPKRSGDQ